MEKREKPNPKDIARLDTAAKNANEVIDKMQRDTVKGYFLLGQILIALRPFFPGQWEKHLEELGIDQTRWKRAKTIAEFFKDEKKLDGISTLEEALKQTQFGRSQNQKSKKPTVKGIGRKATKKVDGPEDDETADQDNTPPATPEELKAVQTFVHAVGGWERANWVLKESHKKWIENQNG